jgi:hypothetical protein
LEYKEDNHKPVKPQVIDGKYRSRHAMLFKVVTARWPDANSHKSWMGWAKLDREYLFFSCTLNTPYGYDKSLDGRQKDNLNDALSEERFRLLNKDWKTSKGYFDDDNDLEESYQMIRNARSRSGKDTKGMMLIKKWHKMGFTFDQARLPHKTILTAIQLFARAGSGNVEGLRQVLKTGIDVNIKTLPMKSDIRNGGGESALMYVADVARCQGAGQKMKNLYNCCRLLLEARADPNLRRNNGRTISTYVKLPLEIACSNEQGKAFPIVRLLLQFKADPNHLRSTVDFSLNKTQYLMYIQPKNDSRLNDGIIKLPNNDKNFRIIIEDLLKAGAQPNKALLREALEMYKRPSGVARKGGPKVNRLPGVHEIFQKYGFVL